MADDEVPRGLTANLNLLAKKLGFPKWARWFICVVAGFVVGLGGCFLFVYLQFQALKADEKKDISETQTMMRTNQGKTDIELTKIRHALELLAEKTPDKDLVNKFLDEKINRWVTPLKKSFESLQTKLDQQASILRVFDPNQILAVVRSEVSFASLNKKFVSDPTLMDLRNAVMAVPQQTPGYWYTAQMVVNYDSEVLQARGIVPDPAKVARPCLGLTSDDSLTSSRNTFSGFKVSNCVVDLDTQSFVSMTFRNCVIRSRGGTFILRNVTFLNCRFVLSLPDGPRSRSEQRFLQTLLSANALNNIRATNG